MYKELRALSIAKSSHDSSISVDNSFKASNTLSKSAQLASCLDFMDGDITITDKFGVIQGTFASQSGL